MKAAVIYEYGAPEVLKIESREKPVPKDNEILVRVHAVHLNYGDMIVRNFAKMPMSEFNMPSIFYFPARMEFGYNKPKVNVLGSEFAGDVVEIGKEVTQFKVGQEVFGYRGQAMGANAEYIAVPENSLIAQKPSNLSYEEAACIPYGAITAMSLLKKVDIKKGTKVLINGASGSIGANALQLAKHYGAEVTAVCGTERMEMVKALGADKVIDYKKQDFTKGSETYDVVFDVLGRSSFNKVKKVLNKGGTYLLASFKMNALMQMLWTSRFGDKQVICALSSDSREDFQTIQHLAEAGKLKAFVDRCYPLEEIAEAHRYMESGKKRGSVLLTV